MKMKKFYKNESRAKTRFSVTTLREIENLDIERLFSSFMNLFCKFIDNIFNENWLCIFLLFIIISQFYSLSKKNLIYFYTMQ